MASPSTAIRLAASQAHCRAVTRHHARSFYFASHSLPPHKRAAAYALYAFCRHIDDLLDLPAGPTPSSPPRTTEPALLALLDQLLSGTAAEPPFAAAFHHAVTTFQVPRQPLAALVHGVCLDRQPLQINRWEELEHYCYHVASVVGLVLCPVLGLRHPPAETHAIELGIAMQLTNILRDIREDFERGRRYLPLEELTRFGVAREDLAAGRLTPGFVGLMTFQIARAREYYRRSEAGIPYLADDGSQRTVWLMRTLYAGILDEIERRHFDVFSGRATVSHPRKLVLALRAWKDHQRTRHPPADA